MLFKNKKRDGKAEYTDTVTERNTPKIYFTD